MLDIVEVILTEYIYRCSTQSNNFIIRKNLLCSICRSTLVESQTILKRWKTPPWKTTLAQSQQASQLEPELGIAQPQLVL